jgi:REP element-mobilizing transposase RayT
MTRQVKKLAHSLYECKYQVVFCPKYRYKILQDEVAKYVTQQIYRLCSQKDGVEVVAINVQKNHQRWWSLTSLRLLQLPLDQPF